MTNSMLPDNGGAAVFDDRAKRGVANPAMFFRRWLANPLQMGSIIPSSDALCRRVVRHTRRAADEAVLELGAGTGVVFPGAPGGRRAGGTTDRCGDRARDGPTPAARAARRAGDRGGRAAAALAAGAALAWAYRQRGVRHTPGAAAD